MKLRNGINKKKKKCRGLLEENLLAHQAFRNPRLPLRLFKTLKEEFTFLL